MKKAQPGAPAGAKIIDISVPIHGRLPLWPGDPPCATSSGRTGGVTISRIEMGVHAGTHLDAPLHFLDHGAAIDSYPLARFVGPARVLDLSGEKEISRAVLETRDLREAERLLLRTINSALWQSPDFRTDFIGLLPDGAEYLLEKGISLVGIDYLSIEAFGSPGNPVHRLLLGHDVLLLEGLDLSAAPEGDYFLVCAPLRLAGLEAAPARAFLLPGHRGLPG